MEADRPAYLIVVHKVTDPAKLQEYGSKVVPIIAKYGGRYLTKSGSHPVLETRNWLPDRVIIFEFPDMAALDTWYISQNTSPLSHSGKRQWT